MSTETVSDAPNRARNGVGVSGSGGAPGGARKRGKAIKFTGTFVAFALPSVVLLLLLNLYPLIYAAWQSLHFGDLVSQGPFVGLQNYASVLTSSDFWNTAGFTLIFTVAGVFGSWAVGLGLALLLRTRIPLNGLWKVLLLLPWIVPTVVSATSWNWLLATPQSPGVIFAHAIGLGNVLFLADPTLAKVTVCVFKVWISFPFMMMMMSSALASVDTNVYEASKVDGAGTWQTFTRITLPMISRTTYISWILMTIFCVNDFPTVFLLLGQGGRANTLVVQAYESVFLNNQVGPGVATAFLMTIVLVIVSVVLYRQIQKVNIE